MCMKINKFVKGTIVYSLSDLIIKAGSMIMLPLFANLMSPKEYGVIGLMTPIGAFIPLFLSFGFYISQSKELIILETEKEKKIYATSLNIFLWLINLGFLILIINPFSINYILKAFALNHDYSIHLKLTLLTGFIGIFVLIGDNFFQTIQNFKIKALGAIISFSINILISFILIFYFNLDSLGKVIGNLSANIFLFGFFYIPYLKQMLINGFSKLYLRGALTIGLPAMLNLIVGNINDYSDRIIISRYLGAAEVGLYSLAYTGGFVLSTFINAVMNSWRPLYFSIEKNSDKENKNMKLNRYLFSNAYILSLVCIVGELFQKEVISIILPNEYVGITYILPFLLCSVLITYYYLFFANIHIFKGTYKLVPLMMCVGMVVNLLINILFMREFGVVIAAISTLISNLLMAFMMILSVKLYHKNDYKFKYKRHLYLFLGVFNPLVVYLSIYAHSTWLTILAKVIYLILFTFMVGKSFVKENVKRIFLKRKIIRSKQC